MDLENAREAIDKLRANLHRVIKGHETSVDLLITAILARGHVLLESVPGEGKTLLASALAASIDGISAGRVSGQPTLKPSDLLGAEIAIGDGRAFELIKGPIFNNIVLFDELNRTDPRTQSALLEAMQEYQVTIGDSSHTLPESRLKIPCRTKAPGNSTPRRSSGSLSRSSGRSRGARRNFRSLANRRVF